MLVDRNNRGLGRRRPPCGDAVLIVQVPQREFSLLTSGRLQPLTSLVGGSFWGQPAAAACPDTGGKPPPHVVSTFGPQGYKGTRGNT